MRLKRRLYIQILLSLTLCIAYSNSTSAQFWRGGRKTRKVNTLNKYPIKPKVSEKPKVEKPKKKRQIDYPESVKKERYRIDVMIPLYLDELVKDDKVIVKGKIPEKAQSGINFYEGIKLAVDTLRFMGYKTDVFIHDIVSKGGEINQLISTDSLKNTDLIIGFVSAQQIAPLAKYAASRKINFISALSPSDANIKDNPYFILMNPTLQNNCEAIVEAVNKKRSKESVILFKKTNTAVDSTAYHFIVGKDDIKNMTELDCTKVPDSAALAALLDSTSKNILLMPLMEAAFAEKLIKNIDKYFPDYRFEIYGMPTWKSITTNKKMIDFGDNISINITQPYYFDPTVSMGKVLSEKYKSVFGGRPNDISYRGFELIYWMTDLLNKYGAVFNEKTDDNSMAVFTRFDLKPKWDKDNNFFYTENRHLYLYHYQAGTVSVAQ
jgi:hypothetical protein